MTAWVLFHQYKSSQWCDLRNRISKHAQSKRIYVSFYKKINESWV